MLHFMNRAYGYDDDQRTANAAENTPSPSNPLAEIVETGELLQQLICEKVEDELDLSVLNRERCTKHAQSDHMTVEEDSYCATSIKIGSLTPFISAIDGQDHDDDLENLLPTAGSVDDNITDEGRKDERMKEEKDRLTKHYINYFALLGQNQNTDDFNYEFVDSLCQGANVNARDAQGQSVMHEVAREWNTDVAYFLKSRGVDIDAADDWGRTPMYVAVASNNIAMIKWLIDNGANLNHRTIKGEGQLAIHYAARYDTIEAFKMLMEHGQDPLVRDEHGRTPFFLAAEAGNTRACTHFLELELPTASYSTSGECTIDHIITNLPSELAERALDQFRAITPMDRSKANVYLSCLGKRRWRLLQQNIGLTKNPAPTVLDIITEKRDLKIINHPVIVQLIKAKRERYGNWFIHLNNFMHILFTLLWTVATTIRVADLDDHGRPHRKTPEARAKEQTVLVFTLAAQLVTFMFVYKLYREWKVTKDYVRRERMRRKIRYQTSERFCHPRWGKEISRFNIRKEIAGNMDFHFWNNGWLMIEVLCLLLSCASTVLTVVWYIDEEYASRHVLSPAHAAFHGMDHHIRLFFSAAFVLVIWVRLNRCFRYHPTFGPFIAMLEECLIASAQIGFLFLEFFIPFAVSFWVVFGSTDPLSAEGSEEYISFNDLIYQLWLLAIVGDYDLQTLVLISPIMAQILVGLYVVVVSIITINIYIALLSDAFSRVNVNASQRSSMEEAIFLTNIELMYPEKRKDFEVYLNKFCAPMVVERSEVYGGETSHRNSRSVVSIVAKTAGELNASLRSLVEGELLNKRDVAALNEEFRVLASKNESARRKAIADGVLQKLDKQSQAFSRVAMKTDETIKGVIRKLTGNEDLM